VICICVLERWLNAWGGGGGEGFYRFTEPNRGKRKSWDMEACVKCIREKGNAYFRVAMWREPHSEKGNIEINSNV
jgi:hypothetical protein